MNRSKKLTRAFLYTGIFGQYDLSAPPLLDVPLLHENAPSQEKKAKTPWKYSPCKLQAKTSFSSSSQRFCSNPHEVCPPSP